jgi:hypothetical protein
MIGMLIWVALAYGYWRICRAGAQEDEECGWK